MSVVDEAPRAWVLNLDAEHELEAGLRYQPTQRIAALVRRERRRLLGELVRPGDIVLTDEHPLDAHGYAGFAWSPTPTALARLAAAGATLAAAPALDLLREVNARAFAAALRAPLAGSSFAKQVATHLEAALEQLARPAALGWLVRRAYGAAGRGRRRIAAGVPSEAERAWLTASLRRGPLVIEPWVHVTREYTRSGWVRANGEVVISAPCFQATTPTGAWLRTEPAQRGQVARSDDLRLEEACATAGAALARAGYSGPFGIDAFRHRPSDGSCADVLNPLSEINARYTMDWVTGMGDRREGLTQQLRNSS